MTGWEHLQNGGEQWCVLTDTGLRREKTAARCLEDVREQVQFAVAPYSNLKGTLRRMVESMPQRFGAVLAARKGPTAYYAGVVIIFWPIGTVTTASIFCMYN